MTKYILTLNAETSDTDYGDAEWADISHRTAVADAEDLENAFIKIAKAMGYEDYLVTVTLKL